MATRFVVSATYRAPKLSCVMAIAGNTQRLPGQNPVGPVTSAAGIFSTGVSVVAPTGSGAYRERPLESPTQISLVGPTTGFWFTQTASGELSPVKVPTGMFVEVPVGMAKIAIWLCPVSAT